MLCLDSVNNGNIRDKKISHIGLFKIHESVIIKTRKKVGKPIRPQCFRAKNLPYVACTYNTLMLLRCRICFNLQRKLFFGSLI